jgi:hypothetical protein
MSVGLKMRLPGWHPLGCTGEELAFYIIQQVAVSILETEGVEASLQDFGDLDDYAREDIDFVLLYDDRFGGVEEPDSPLAQVAGFGKPLGQIPTGRGLAAEFTFLH